MNVRPLLRPLLAAALAVGAFPTQAAGLTVYDSARLVVLDTVAATIGLDGFGRVITDSLPLATPLRGADFSTQAVARELFFDTWNLDVSGIQPGLYSFSAFVIEASGSLEFDSVTFNSIDEVGVRNTVLFDLNALHTQAVGSGLFTVRSACPIQSCVWIDIAGTQAAGALGEGYGGSLTAVMVPEPSSWALMLLGAAGVSGWVGRRRATVAARSAGPAP